MNSTEFSDLASHVMKAIAAYERDLGRKISVAIATGVSEAGIPYIRIEDDEFEPLPVLNRDEDCVVRSMEKREIWRRSAMSDWAQAAVITLEEKGLLCEDDDSPDTIYITNAGKAYVAGKRLPKIVIPPYK